MVSIRVLGILILCAVAAFIVCIANKEVFEGKGVANAIVTWAVITVIFTAIVLLVWSGVVMVVKGVL